MEPKQSGPGGTERSSSIGDWYFPLLLAIALLLLLALAQQLSHQGPDGAAGTDASWTPSPEPEGETVSLTIDFGNGASRQFAALPWRAEMTVADLLDAARNFRPGIEFTQVGSGESGLLTEFDGLSNEGANGRNWLYQVDDEHAHVSFCLKKLELGMHVLWLFTDELYNAEVEK